MYKVVYLPDQQNIVVDLIQEDQDITVNGAALLETEVEALPEATAEAIQHIKDNPYKSFKLHKVENGQVVCRTVQDLESLPFAEWTRDYSVVEPEPQEPVVEEETPE